MGSWCAENLRDSSAWASEKLPLTVSSDEVAKLFDCSLRQLVSWIDCEQMGGLEVTLKRMREAEPNFLMGQIFSLGLNAMGTGRSVRADPAFGPELDKMVADAMANGNLREQRHSRAIQYFANGEMQSACIEWEKILAEHPNDLMALKFAHDAYFFAGDKTGKRDSVARVIGKWEKTAPCYSYLHGMYAFGLEECGQYVEAEKEARIGLQLQPKDCWSTHAICHCFEMASNFEDGIKFMESTENDWAPCNLLACHNYWHNALFYIEKGDFESAMTIFDKEVEDRSKSCAMLDMVDTASLLLRFEMEGFETGKKRWENLLKLVEPHIDDHVLAFNDAHISMVLGRAGDEEMLTRHHQSIAKFVKDGIGGNARIMRDFGEQICEAITAYNLDNFAKAFDLLYPIRTQIYRIGGSHAQRDVFTQILIHAGFRAGDNERRQKALEVIKERNKYKPNSNLVERLLQRHKTAEGPNEKMMMQH